MSERRPNIWTEGWIIHPKFPFTVTTKNLVDVATVTNVKYAPLIAAAPDLLEASKYAVAALEVAEYRMRVKDWAEGSSEENDEDLAGAVHDYKTTLKDLQRALGYAKAAIAKAEGKS